MLLIFVHQQIQLNVIKLTFLFLLFVFVYVFIAATSGTLTRSKSADSVVTAALNLTCPVISHQPSSLSLNDVENLEKECLADSKASSAEYVGRIEEAACEEEPEALIVEVEDIVEETAAPLVENYLVKEHTPIYQHETIKSMW